MLAKFASTIMELDKIQETLLRVSFEYLLIQFITKICSQQFDSPNCMSENR